MLNLRCPQTCPPHISINLEVGPGKEAGDLCFLTLVGIVAGVSPCVSLSLYNLFFRLGFCAMWWDVHDTVVWHADTEWREYGEVLSLSTSRHQVCTNDGLCIIVALALCSQQAENGGALDLKQARKFLSFHSTNEIWKFQFLFLTRLLL